MTCVIAHDIFKTTSAITHEEEDEEKMIKRDFVMNFGLVFVGVVAIMSMAERNLVTVLGGIVALILNPIIYFIFRKK